MPFLQFGWSEYTQHFDHTFGQHPCIGDFCCFCVWVAPLYHLDPVINYDSKSKRSSLSLPCACASSVASAFCYQNQQGHKLRSFWLQRDTRLFVMNGNEQGLRLIVTSPGRARGTALLIAARITPFYFLGN
jgi:hypothetical protein